MPTIQPAYEGSEKYIFISYSHKDADKVHPIIDRLKSEGYRVWYDRLLYSGEKYNEIIANRLISCRCYIAMMSPDYIDSQYCRKELTFLTGNNKDGFLVYLEKTELADGIRFLVNGIQHIFMSDYENEDEFYKALLASPVLAACKADTPYTKDFGNVKPKANSSVALEIQCKIRDIYSILIEFKEAIRADDDNRLAKARKDIDSAMRGLYALYEPHLYSDDEFVMAAKKVVEQYNIFVVAYNALSAIWQQRPRPADFEELAQRTTDEFEALIRLVIKLLP